MSHDKHAGKHTSTSKLHEKLDAEHQKKTTSAKETDIELENEDQENSNYLSYDELRDKLKEAETKASQSWDRALRIQAEMDNMHRRTERDVENAHKYALEKFAMDLLPVVDNLERSLENHNEADKAVIEGVQLTLKSFTDTLKKYNVDQIDPVGQPFNPELHQAVSVQSDPQFKPNTVISVLQKGYMLNNRLIRPALVVVSK